MCSFSVRERGVLYSEQCAVEVERVGKGVYSEHCAVERVGNGVSTAYSVFGRDRIVRASD